MHIIVGLGNPGDEYVGTRHNVGWTMLSHVAEKYRMPAFIDSGKYSGEISEGSFEGSEVLMLMPHTYMNRSGGAVKKALALTGAAPASVVVVHDDIDLPIGTVKISAGRGAGGHNGIQSIIDTLGTKDFARVRVGIGKGGLLGMFKRPHGDALAKYVLGTFKGEEQKLIDEVKEKVADALVRIVRDGVEKAMNALN